MRNIGPLIRFAFLSLLTSAAAPYAEAQAQRPHPVADTRIPSDRVQVVLIKNTLIALNHANVSGNYTVLRDLCSPQLRERQKASDLALAFRDTHDRSRDLSFVLTMNPIPAQSQMVSTDGRLRLVGYFPTRPQELHYDLTFLKTAKGDWWIDGIGIRSQQPAIANRPRNPVR